MVELTVRTAWIVGPVSLLCSCNETTQDVADRTAEDVAAIRSLRDRVEQTFEAGELDAAMSLFAEDAVALGAGEPDIVGREAIRDMYSQLLDQYELAMELSSAEIEIAGDLAYERGTYTLKLTEKSTGRVSAVSASGRSSNPRSAISSTADKAPLSFSRQAILLFPS